MSNKVKMKCATCHKSFKSSKPTQIYCEDCERKRRQEKGTTTLVPSAQAPTPTPAGTKPTWLEKAIVRDEQTPITPLVASDRAFPPPREHGAPRSARAPRPMPSAAPSNVIPTPSFPKKVVKATRSEAPKPSKPPREPAKPYEPTAAQKAAIEQRYLELAQPEFDGIRTQIAHELQLPKSAVKHVIATLRAQQHLPSWWEVQNFAGSADDLERIKVAYMAALPTPSLGIHKQIADTLQLSPAQVYHAIRSIRLALGMPIFNPPEVHPELQPMAAPTPAPVS